MTGRRDCIRTLRQGGGLSSFTKRSGSDYDPFGAAHSSTSIPAAPGSTVARDMGRPTGDAVAVIGDGAISAGMAYEARTGPRRRPPRAPDRRPRLRSARAHFIDQASPAEMYATAGDIAAVALGTLA